jgi:hypothetical protein
MKRLFDFNGTKSSADTGVAKVVTFYENPIFVTGLRGESIASRLADSLGCSCDLSENAWRNDFLERENVAAVAMLAAMDADYVILSLLGEHAIPIAARNWIEAWLGNAGWRCASLIVLADHDHSDCHMLEGTRHYLHCAYAARRDVAFSSDAGMQDESCVTADFSARDEAFEFELSRCRRVSAPHFTLNHK